MRLLRSAIEFLGDANTTDAKQLRRAIRDIQGTIDFSPDANPFTAILPRLSGYPRSVIHLAEAAESRWRQQMPEVTTCR